jgi:hypothetical protein
VVAVAAMAVMMVVARRRRRMGVALAMHLGVPEIVVEKPMTRADSVMLASLIHLLDKLEDLREHDAAGLLLIGMPQAIYHHHHHYR